MKYVAAIAASAFLLFASPVSALPLPGMTASPSFDVVAEKKKKAKQVRRVDRKEGMSTSDRLARCIARRSAQACSRIK